MEDMIVIRAMESGVWMVQVRVRKGRQELIERGTVCKI